MARGRGYFWWRKPNPGEQKLLGLLNQHSLPYRYVGNGEVWLGKRNPDHINVNGEKKVIELFSTRYHPIFDVADRTEHYKQYGYRVLIVWSSELHDLPKLAKRIKSFR